jgi:hypothetical protein
MVLPGLRVSALEFGGCRTSLLPGGEKVPAGG